MRSGPVECPLDRHLLVEAESDQERGGVLADEPIRLRVAGPLELRAADAVAVPRVYGTAQRRRS